MLRTEWSTMAVNSGWQRKVLIQLVAFALLAIPLPVAIVQRAGQNFIMSLRLLGAFVCPEVPHVSQIGAGQPPGGHGKPFCPRAFLTQLKWKNDS